MRGDLQNKSCPATLLLSIKIHIHPQGGQRGHTVWELFLICLYLDEDRYLDTDIDIPHLTLCV